MHRKVYYIRSNITQIVSGADELPISSGIDSRSRSTQAPSRINRGRTWTGLPRFAIPPVARAAALCLPVHVDVHRVRDDLPQGWTEEAAVDRKLLVGIRRGRTPDVL